MSTVIVTGGRHYADRDALHAALGQLRAQLGFTLLIAGDATGADALALEWAHKNRIAATRFEADWAAHGKAAGPRRNAAMLREAQACCGVTPLVVVAFPGGAGTADMVRRATRAGVTVIYAGRQCRPPQEGDPA